MKLYRYELVITHVQEWIVNGVLRPGDRLPSVRDMGARLGYSTVTIHQAYCIMESRGILTARPRSGFYVSEAAKPLPEFDSTSDQKTQRVGSAPTPIVDINMRYAWQLSHDTGLGSGRISDDLIPVDELYRAYVGGLRWEANQRSSQVGNGLPELREIIAKRLSGSRSIVQSDNIAVVRNFEDAMGLSLDLLTGQGSTILVETPVDSTTVAAIIHRRLRVLEIYSDPRTGINLDQFDYLLETNSISACIVSPRDHVPTGVSYPAETSKRIVEIATKHNVPIIECVSDRDLSFDNLWQEMASFDTRGLVLRAGSFVNTLGSKFGLGWAVIPRRFGVPQLSSYYTRQLVGYLALQRTIAKFIQQGRYERHRRRLRERLVTRVQHGLSLIFQAFPETCTVSRPKGGYLCWLRCPEPFNSVATLNKVRETGISFIPGPAFSVSRSFENFLALNLSHPWTPEQEQNIKRLGDILHMQQGRSF